MSLSRDGTSCVSYLPYCHRRCSRPSRLTPLLQYPVSCKHSQQGMRINARIDDCHHQRQRRGRRQKQPDRSLVMSPSLMRRDPSSCRTSVIESITAKALPSEAPRSFRMFCRTTAHTALSILAPDISRPKKAAVATGSPETCLLVAL